MSTPVRRRVKPADGLLIRDPYTKLRIPPEGIEVVTEGNYGTQIQKHLSTGDLIEIFVDPAEPQAQPEPTPATPKNALREVGTDQRRAEGVTSATKSADKSEV